MERVYLSTRYYLDPAVASLPDADTELLFVRALAYAGAEETGGFIPDAIVPSLIRRRRTGAAVEALVARSLWIPASGDRGQPGHLIARWQEWQEELEALARRRSSDRQRKRRERDRKTAASTDPPRPRGRPPKPQVKNMSRDMSADCPQKVPSRARADDDLDQSSGSQVGQSSLADARARKLKPGTPEFRLHVIAEFAGQTGTEIDDVTADVITTDVLGRSKTPVTYPLPFVLAAIRNETDPRGRWLPRPEPRDQSAQLQWCGDRYCNRKTRRREDPATGNDAGPCPKCSGHAPPWENAI